jgi:elongator complex protein 1
LGLLGRTRPLQVSFLARDEPVVLVCGGDGAWSHYFVDIPARSVRGPEQPQPASPSTFHSFLGQEGAYGLYGQDMAGCLHDLGSLESAPPGLRFPLQLPWCEIVPVHHQLIAFGMSRNGHLYANTRQLVKNCTSFLVTPAHLVFTTSNHLIKFVHLTDVESKQRPAAFERGRH